MIYLLTAAIGMITARWLNWFSLVVITMVFSIAIGIEGALHARPFVMVLQRGLEVNVTLQGAYLGQAFILVFGPRLLRRSGRQERPGAGLRAEFDPLSGSCGASDAPDRHPHPPRAP